MQKLVLFADLDPDLPSVFMPQDAVANAVLDQGLDDQRRDGPGFAAFLHVEVDPDAVAEAGLFDGQVAADLIQLLGQGHEPPAGFQALAQVAGEILQQVARFLGAGAAE